MQPLRFATAGSVDDGKSTLIGRLLYDARAVQEDQLAAVERASLRRGGYMDIKGLIQSADTALYKVKARGRDGIEIADM